MSKVVIDRQGLSDILVFGEFQPIIIGDGVNLVSIRGQSLHDTLTHWLGVFGLWFGQNCVFGFTLYMSSDYTLVTFTYNCIALPVADARFTANDSWAFFNADTVDDTSSAILFAITFTPLFLTAQVLV